MASAFNVIILLLQLLVILSTAIRKEDSFALSLFQRHESGDIVGGYKLVEHVDYIGVAYAHPADDYDLAMIEYENRQTLLSITFQTQQGGVLTVPTPPGKHSLLNHENCRRGDFCLNKNVFLGGHGEIWRANRILDDDALDLNSSFILKRMHIHNNLDIQRCAEREIYFGNLLKGNPLFTRLDSFFSNEQDYWLVFVDDGISLNNLLYAITNRDINPVLQPSLFWNKLRTTNAGKATMKGIIHQLVKAVAALHDQEILHRDIKPSNLLINTEGTPRLIVADFSSAVSNAAIALELYGDAGPSLHEETERYAPPEVLVSSPEKPVAYELASPYSYDIWSVGVVFLELILGTEQVFSVDQRTDAMIKMRMRGAAEGKTKLAALHAAWSEYCIFPGVSEPSPLVTSSLPRASSDFHELHPVFSVDPVKRQCGLNELSKAILRRDPLGLGFDDYWGLELLSRLLRWDPEARVDMKTAARHAYFTGPYISDIDGSEHGTSEDLVRHNVQLINPEAGEVSVDATADAAAREESVHLMNEALLSCSVQSCSVGAADQDEVAETRRLPLDELDPLTFRCPQCHREFSDWESCHKHLTARKHGKRCVYDRSKLLPCLSQHSLLPIDPNSGWCEYTGRRKYIEDFHSIVFSDSFKYFGVFDGHFGSRAARFAAKNLHGYFEMHLQAQSLQSAGDDTSRHNSSNERLAAINGAEHWATVDRMLVSSDTDVLVSEEISNAHVVNAILQAFSSTNSMFEKYSDEDEKSGTTATVAVLFDDFLLLSHVGDSRAVLCCSERGNAIQLTVDHTPYDGDERSRIEALGGRIVNTGNILRVNGNLAVTRSLGDKGMRMVSASPDILLLSLRGDKGYQPEAEATSSCGLTRTDLEQFLIVASDGLWDVVSNSEAVSILCEFFEEEMHADEGSLPSDAFQRGAQILAQEAFVRGSSDNIGVCVINIGHLR